MGITANIRQSLARWLYNPLPMDEQVQEDLYEEKYHRILAQVINPHDQDMGIEAPRSYQIKEFLLVYGEGEMANVWIKRAVSSIAEAVAQLSLLMQQQQKDGKWKTVMSGPAIRLFKDINPVMTYYDFFEAVMSYLELAGNSFLALENFSERTGFPREIWPIRPDLIRIHPDEETGEVLGYSVHLGVGQKPILYSRNEMIHLKYFSPTNYYWGLSPLAAHKKGILFEFLTKQYEINFFKAGVRESGILTSEGKLSDPQFERLRKQVESRYGGVEKMHRPMLLEGGLKWNPTSVKPKDMEYKELKEWTKDEVQAAYNIPPLKLMDLTEASVLANAEVQERMFVTDCLIPRLKKLEGLLNEFLLPFFFTKKTDLFQHRFIFDLSSISSLQLSEPIRSEVATRLTTGNNPLMSVDESRDRFYNLGPAPWGGKEPMVPANLLPASLISTNGTNLEQRIQGFIEAKIKELVPTQTEKLIELSLKDCDAGMIDGDDGEEKGEEIEMALDPYEDAYIWALDPEFEISDEHQNLWREFASKRLKDENRFVKALNEEFRRELAETLANLEAMDADQVIPASSLLFDEHKAITEMKGIYEDQFGLIVRNAAQEDFELWGLSNPLDVNSPTVIEFGNNTASWFAGIGRENLGPNQYPGVTGTQLNKLEKALNAGLQKGESIPELTKRVQDVFKGTIREKGFAARRIARTETIRISNFSRETQYNLNRHLISGKQWIAQLDSTTDEICVELHGEIVPLTESFSLGISAPPDPHCFTTPQTPIFTSKGWKNIGDIREGELVLTHKGRFRKVLKQFIHKRKPDTDVVRITLAQPFYRHSLKKYPPITTKHPVLLADGRWVEAQDIKPGDKLQYLAGKECSGCGKPLPFEYNYNNCSCKCASKANATRISDTLKKFYSDPQNREKRSQEMKQYLSDPDNLAAMKDGVNGFWASNPRREEVRDGIREKVTANYKNGVVDRFEITKAANAKTRQMYRDGKQIGFKDTKLWKNSRRMLGKKAYGGTKPELLMKEHLESRGIAVNPQHRIQGPPYDNLSKYNPIGRCRHYWIDLAIPDKKIAIECENLYWHGENRKEKDRRRLEWLESQGWTVLRFSDKEIFDDVVGCVDEVERVKNNHEGKYVFSAVEVSSVEHDTLSNGGQLYNLSVEEDNSYVAKGIIVHNSNCRCALIPVLIEPTDNIQTTQTPEEEI
jgi:HK97 family phage portal protein